MTQGLSLDLPAHHTNEWYNPPTLYRRYLAETILTYIGKYQVITYHTCIDKNKKAEWPVAQLMELCQQYL